MIVAGTWRLLRGSVDLAMDVVPPSIDRAGIETGLRALPSVVEVHDLHLGAQHHLDGEGLVRRATELVRAEGIGHATLQVEAPALAAACAPRPDGVLQATAADAPGARGNLGRPSIRRPYGAGRPGAARNR